MTQTRKQLWIAMSDLWLDQDLEAYQLQSIADVVRESGLDEPELDKIFALELAPFLGANHLTATGVWDGFDRQWVCQQARIRYTRYRWRDRVSAALGITTYAARPYWNRVKAMAFGSRPEDS